MPGDGARAGWLRHLSGAARRLRHRLDEPLLLATLAAIVGIVLADRGLYHPLSAAAALALGLAFALRSRKRSFLLLAVAGTFAFAHHQRRSAALDLPCSNEIAAGLELLVEAEGVIDSIPKASSHGSPGRVSFFLRLTHLRQLGGGRATATQRLFVTATADPPPAYGDRIRLGGHLRAPDRPRNPGEFDFGTYLLRSGVIAQLSAEPKPGIRLLETGQGNPAIAAADRARRWVAATITRDLQPRDPEIAGTLTAMTLGSRTDTPDEIIDSFRTSGTLHIFAVSGLHVGLIAVILWHLLAPLPCGRRVRALVVILTLCGYAFVTGLRPSAVRATIMACLVLAAPLCDREPRIINSLGAAGFAILACDSNQLFLPGFQLSFAVLLSLTLLHRPILAALLPLASHDPFLPASLLTDRQRICYRAARALAETLAVSLAAWLGSLPLMLYHFQLVTPVAPVANLFLIPVAFCVLGTAILSTLAGGLGLGTLCAILNNANFLWASILTATAGAFSDLPVPLSHFYTGTPNALRPPCQITVLDLPRGGASTLIATRGGRDWLVDTGSQRDFRPSVAAFLHGHAGVTGIDSLLLTHADATHIGAAADVIATFRPETIHPPPATSASSTYRALAAVLGDQPAASRACSQGEVVTIDSGCSIEILYAPAPGQVPRLGDDACIVFLLHAHGWRLLFTGDAGFPTERRLLDDHPGQLRADVIIRGHHSADYALTPEFLAAVAPRAIIANARDFENQSPGDQVWRKAAAARQIAIFDQAECGAVTVKIHPDRIAIESFLTAQGLTMKRAR